MIVKRFVAIVLFVPLLVAAGEAASFHMRNRNNGSIVSGGERREYLLYVPRGYVRSKPVPLVISLHGAGGWPKQQMELSGWNDLADRENFIVVYPSGYDGPGPRVWRAGAGLMKDVQFMRDLIDTIASDYDIDRRRIYVNGFSNGGGMAFVLSCRMADRVAAVGLVAPALNLPFTWCGDDHAVPLIAFQGTEDPDVPYGGGTSWMAHGPFAGIERFAAAWAHRNRCRRAPAVTTAANNVMRREYRNCAEEASVVLYTIHGGGHTWPGGGAMPEYFVGRNTNDISATEEMWAFFRAHPLLSAVDEPTRRTDTRGAQETTGGGPSF